MMSIRVGFTDCGGWDCWECQAPGTLILHRMWTPRVVFASGSPADFDGLGVTENQGESLALQRGDESDDSVHKPPFDGTAGYS
ncbi:MAG: hypothetical protein PPP55_02000, partial [Halorubrum sp.]